MDKISYIVEEKREIPIIDETEILVAGGGTAGAVAAMAAARGGAKVLIVEQFGSLGGSATEALVTPLMHTGIDGNPMCSSISDEMNERMIALGYGYRDTAENAGHFDPVMLKFVLEEMAEEAGVRVLYYTHISDVVKEGNKVTGIIVENKGGRGAIRASRIIDCTGDADVAVRAGVSFESGKPGTGENQPISLRYMMSGINIELFTAFLQELDKGFTYNPPLFHTAMVWGRGWPLEPIFKKAMEAGDITYEDGAYWQVFGIPGKKDALAFNCPEIFKEVNGTNPNDLTQAQLNGKKSILRHLKFYKNYFPGFEECYITAIAGQVGVRESRRIKGIYELSDEDVILNRKFEDAVVKSNYPVDIHGYDLLNKHIDMEDKDPVPYYEIPYRCLVPIGVEQLIVAGRCISASFLAESTLRIQPTVRALGEAAGIAAVISLRKNVSFSEIIGEEVRKVMIDRGAIF